jgi:hypothetical protein
MPKKIKIYPQIINKPITAYIHYIEYIKKKYTIYCVFLLLLYPQWVILSMGLKKAQQIKA